MTTKIFYKYLKQVSWNGTSISQDDIRKFWNGFSEEIISQLNTPTFTSQDLQYPGSNVKPKILATVNSGPTITFTFESSFNDENGNNLSNKYIGDGSMRFEKSNLPINSKQKELPTILQNLVKTVNESKVEKQRALNARDTSPRPDVFTTNSAENLENEVLNNKQELLKIDNQSFKDAFIKIDKNKIDVFYRWFNKQYSLAKDFPSVAKGRGITDSDIQRLGEIAELIQSVKNNPESNQIISQLDLQAPQSLAFNRDTQESSKKDIKDAFTEIFKKLRESLLSDITSKLKQNNIEVKIVEYKDVEPQLVGPPTQNISGVEFKPPTVDNPNIKLPTQEVKSLTAQSANDAVTQSTIISKPISVPTTPISISNPNSTLDRQIIKEAYISPESLTTSENVPVYSGGSTMESKYISPESLTVPEPNINYEGGSVMSVTQVQTYQSSENLSIKESIPNYEGGSIMESTPSVTIPSGPLQTPITRPPNLISSRAKSLNPKGIKPDGLGKDWSPDKFSPESIAGNTKYVDPKTGQIGSTATLAKTLGATALGGGIGAGIGAIAGGGQGALIGGLSGGAIGAGAALGGIGGTALAGAGLGGGIGTVVGGGQGALIGAASGGIVGAAAAKLASVQKDMPKPNIPKPPNTSRIKTVKIPRPDSTKGAQALLNLPKSPTF